MIRCSPPWWQSLLLPMYFSPLHPYPYNVPLLPEKWEKRNIWWYPVWVTREYAEVTHAPSVQSCIPDDSVVGRFLVFRGWSADAADNLQTTLPMMGTTGNSHALLVIGSLCFALLRCWIDSKSERDQGGYVMWLSHVLMYFTSLINYHH
jgi:hypothetical protein